MFLSAIGPSCSFAVFPVLASLTISSHLAPFLHGHCGSLGTTTAPLSAMVVLLSAAVRSGCVSLVHMPCLVSFTLEAAALILLWKGIILSPAPWTTASRFARCFSLGILTTAFSSIFLRNSSASSTSIEPLSSSRWLIMTSFSSEFMDLFIISNLMMGVVGGFLTRYLVHVSFSSLNLMSSILMVKTGGSILIMSLVAFLEWCLSLWSLKAVLYLSNLPRSPLPSS